MAWKMKVVGIPDKGPALDADGNPLTIDLAEQGQFVIRVEYFDDAAPAVILYRTTYQTPWSSSMDGAQVVTALKQMGARARDTRAFVVAAKTTYEGKTVNV